MIEGIAEYLRLLDYDVSIKDKRIITKHFYNDELITIAGELPLIFPRYLPVFYLYERKKYGSLAHVGWYNNDDSDEGVICEGITINRSIDFSEPNLVYVEALKLAFNTVIKALSDSEYNKQEVIKEFSAHWRHACIKEKQKVISFIEPDYMIKEIEIYQPLISSGNDLPFFINGQVDQINSEYKFLGNLMKKGQSKGKAVYIPVKNCILPPNPKTILISRHY
jgi:hypothetical protein